jgi:hypothetical protein
MILDLFKSGEDEPTKKPSTIQYVLKIIVSIQASHFFVLKQKSKQKNSRLQNAPAQILQKVKCGRMISDSYFVLIY